MMQKKWIFFFLWAGALAAGPASAGNLPEAVAYDASIEAAAQVFSSPALPSLDNDGTSISPLYGLVTMDGVDETGSLADGEEFKIENRGQIKGQVAGLTFNHSGKGDLGFFATAAWSQVGGDLKTTTSFNTQDIRDISAQNYIGVVGVNYRLVGTATSGFALGIFGGPAIVIAQTSARFHHQDGTTTKVTLDPQSYAGYLGLQMMFRIKKFRINPYLNILANTEVGCYKPTYEGDPYPEGEYNICNNGQRGISAMTGMVGMGINVAYGRLGFGLVSQGSGTNQGFKSTPLIFSLRISL